MISVCILTAELLPAEEAKEELVLLTKLGHRHCVIRYRYSIAYAHTRFSGEPELRDAENVIFVKDRS